MNWQKGPWWNFTWKKCNSQKRKSLFKSNLDKEKAVIKMFIMSEKRTDERKTL